MYLNDIHILFYVLFCILGIISGQVSSWCIKRMPEHKTVITKDFFKEFKIDYKLIIITVIIYMLLLVTHGIKNQFLTNLELIKYTILTPMIISAFVIDYKHQIIPNRLNLTIFEVGLASCIVSGMYSMNLMTNALLGMAVGGGVFLIITLIGGLIAGKEAMGFGDVKFMGALGLYFGFANIITITLMSFLFAAVISVFLLMTKIKKKSEYIPFGPFIVIACFINMLVPFGIIFLILAKIFTLGMA